MLPKGACQLADATLSKEALDDTGLSFGLFSRRLVRTLAISAPLTVDKWAINDESINEDDPREPSDVLI